MLQDLPTDPTDREFDDLPADADERDPPGPRRAHGALRPSHPGHASGAEGTALRRPARERFVAETLDAAMRELYNPAQLDVLQRISALLERGSGVSRP